MKTSKEKNKGITLIALVVTIVILLILAGVTVILLLGEGNIFEKAQDAKEKHENAQAQENAILSDYQNTINEYADGYVESSRDTITISREELNSIIDERIAENTKIAITEEQLNSLGEMQVVTKTITPTAKTNSTICELTLESGKYILFGKVAEESSNSNYLDVTISGANYSGAENVVVANKKKVNVSAFVDIAENQTKTVKLTVWSQNAYSTTGSMVAIKLK